MKISLKKIQSHHEWLEDALIEMSRDLLTASEMQKISVDMEYLDPSDPSYAECDWIDDECKAVIRINRNIQDPRMLVRSIAHELAHVKQFFRYELIALRDDRWMWNGEIVRSVAGSKRNYHTPWEVEARQIEDVLAKKWLGQEPE